MKSFPIVITVFCTLTLLAIGCSDQPTEAEANSSSAKRIETSISAEDIALANSIIKANTMSIPGFGVGTRVNVGPGKLSAADALVVYLLKYHRDAGVCPPIEVVANLLASLGDARFAKKAVAVFWLDYSTAKIDDAYLKKASFLKDSFEWYINTKTTEKMKIANLQMTGFVGAGEAWQKAVKSQRKSWQQSKNNEDDYYLVRDQYRLQLNAQSAVSMAERAVSSGF